MPDLTTVLTGCDCHPPSGFTLQQGDVISITIAGIGTLENTVIGNGVKLDNLIQVAHNVQIGDHSAMAALVGVADNISSCLSQR